MAHRSRRRTVPKAAVPAGKALADRFSGTDAKRLICEALLRQRLVEGKREVAQRLAAVARIEGYEVGEAIITQGDTDTDILFILAGSVVVSPNNRDDTTRPAGTHVGEMATIDPAARRSATVRAREPSALARVDESQFSRIAAAHPYIWRHLAREMADRLRERVAKVPERKATPRVFIGSSAEALSAAQELQAALKKGAIGVHLWTDDIFVPSWTNVEALEAELERVDFAVLILSPDDKVVSRKTAKSAPRDNVILELGLFAGKIGRKRTFMACPQTVDLKIPSDFLGVNPIKYDPAAGTKSIAATIKALVDDLGPR